MKLINMDRKFLLKIEMMIKCIERGNLDMVIYLIENEKIHVNFKLSNGTWLHRAAIFGQVDIVKYLLSKGAEVNFEENGFTPLAVAAEVGDVEIAEILIKHGAKIDFEADGDDFLQQAILSDKPKMIDFVLNHGVDINRLDSESMTPLAKAMIRPRYKSLKHLLQKGADYRKLSVFKIYGKHYPLMACIGSKFEGSIKSIDILLDHIEEKEGKKALIDYINYGENECGFTALHKACYLQEVEVVMKLIKRGANTQISTRRGIKLVDELMFKGENQVSRRIRSMLEAAQKKPTTKEKSDIHDE